MGVTLKRDTTLWPDGWDKPSVTVPAGAVLHAGAVLGRGVDYGVRIMSDVWADSFYAEYWDAASGSVKHYGLGNTEFGSDATATVDADADTYAKAFAWVVASEYTKLVNDFNARAARAADAANALAKGKMVEVVKGRKVSKGTTGVVIWLGASNFGPRVGFKDDAGTVHFTAASNVTVTDGWDHFDVEPWLLTDDRKAAFHKMAVKAALAHAGRNGWVTEDAAAAAIAAAA